MLAWPTSVLTFRERTLKCVVAVGVDVDNDRVMSAVIEVRTYRSTPGTRTQLLELLRSRAFPVQRELGMKILGPFPSREDDVTFVWLRGFPDEASRAPLKAAFYEGHDWLGGLEDQVMPMIDDYGAVVVQDTEDLLSLWPTTLP